VTCPGLCIEARLAWGSLAGFSRFRGSFPAASLKHEARHGPERAPRGFRGSFPAASLKLIDVPTTIGVQLMFPREFSRGLIEA